MQLLTQDEVMEKLHIKSRDTIHRYKKKRGFPKPVKTHPSLYAEEHINQWLLRQTEI